MSLVLYAHKCICRCECRPQALGPLKLELQAVMSHLLSLSADNQTQALCKSRVPLNHGTIWSALTGCFKMNLAVVCTKYASTHDPSRLRFCIGHLSCNHRQQNFQQFKRVVNCSLTVVGFSAARLKQCTFQCSVCYAESRMCPLTLSLPSVQNLLKAVSFSLSTPFTPAHKCRCSV